MNEVARKAEPMDDDVLIEKIEVSFELPCYVTQEQQHALWEVLREIVKAPVNQVGGHAHWLSGNGSKPNWSKQDSLFLGRRPSDFARVTGEPTFDDSVLFFESSFRED